VIETPRLLLRNWKASDGAPFAALNTDSRVMEFMPRVLTAEESAAVVERIEAHFRVHGFGLFAAELRETGAFIGYVGLSVPHFQAKFMPCVEIGWRLAAEQWNRGLATEGARAVFGYAFQTLRLEEVISFTVPSNSASRRVMEKFGMRHDESDDFDHPDLPEGHALRRHVLYRLHKSEFGSSEPADDSSQTEGQ
jgi:3-dehydroquinate dehydratase/shikimate dehydrogenase